MTAEERFAKLTLEFAPAPTPVGVYKPCVIDGNHLYVSGHGPLQAKKNIHHRPHW